ncbi:hypothetical protein [Plantactinospora endophytica]|uniref:Uncharacterized protein n=1 Tax=Plantactinospora endophytica TaxID=673535 RepID=A0ABQ4EDJ2_9ACTN|nr:hypothetical protein [Plantactinospora endophytica]GIG92759.1 hypothetical protein Pen02_76950 [Plantactinospora endophytica]
MPAKRKSRSAARTTAAKSTGAGALGTGATARLGRPDGETVELAAPVVLPADDRTPEAARPAAPKAGPVNRNGAGPLGVGRGRGAGAARRYAFRRS